MFIQDSNPNNIKLHVQVNIVITLHNSILKCKKRVGCFHQVSQICTCRQHRHCYIALRSWQCLPRFPLLLGIAAWLLMMPEFNCWLLLPTVLEDKATFALNALLKSANSSSPPLQKKHGHSVPSDSATADHKEYGHQISNWSVSQLSSPVFTCLHLSVS